MRQLLIAIAPGVAALTVGLSAFLLFWLQLFTAKSLLPLVGGTPAVWNTCQCFFQVSLVLGYAYADRVSRPGQGRATGGPIGQVRSLWQRWIRVWPRRWRLGPIGRQAIVLAVPLIVLPVGFPQPDATAIDRPILWLLATLASAVGLPFLALATTGPLVQAWLGRSLANHPYWLYGASNAGSLLGVLGYPLAIEPWLSLRSQAQLWQGAYVLTAGLVLFCAIASQENAKPAIASLAEISETREISEMGGPRTELERSADDDRPTWRDRLRWTILAFLPASASLGVTTYITTDIAAVPLLWAVPLAIYLLTLIWAFRPQATGIDRPGLGRSTPGWLVAWVPIVIVPLLVLSRVDAVQNLWVLLVGHWLALALIGTVAHGWLADLKPAAPWSTAFYLYGAIGGALAGAFNAIVAPLLFPGIWEYPFTLVWFLALTPGAIAPGISRWAWATIGLGFGALVVGFQPGHWPEHLPGLALAIAALFSLRAAFGLSKLGLAIAAIALVLVAQFSLGLRGQVEAIDRSFFGLNRVVVDRQARFRQLIHGTTLHGQQRLSSDLQERNQPLTYFDRTGPVGDFFQALRQQQAQIQIHPIHPTQNQPHQRIAVLGLGVGTLATYAQPGESWEFYEIDPAVIAIAQNRQWFTFLHDSPAHLTIHPGDGRLGLKQANNRAFNVIIMDAFSSDAVPVHLLTKEAILLYLSKLDTKGLILLNITNRYVDLLPVLAAISGDFELNAIHCWDRQYSDQDRQRGKTPSHWVILSKDSRPLPGLNADRCWQPMSLNSHVLPWTDNVSSLLPILRWP